ncbi:MAG: hypothetical protein ABI658_26740 [Acidimicrobiales bacterium]
MSRTLRTLIGKTAYVETMFAAIERLRKNGYGIDLSAAPESRLLCGACGDFAEAADATVEEIVRFEGDSNPDDQAILIAVFTPCGHRGLYVAPYGPNAPALDAQLLRALSAR